MKTELAAVKENLAYPKEGGTCYLGICSLRDKPRVKRTLSMMPSVYRITDHGEHLKIKSHKPLTPIRGFKWVNVPDETTHFDPKYWDFVFAAFAHATKHGHSHKKALSIMIHYCFNMFGSGDEALYLAKLALRRSRLDAVATGELSHGWEFPHIAKLRKGK